jgi:drug/metabolite transporter (DMT)-like permease
MSLSENNLNRHPFPMIRSGGLFVLFVGLGIVTGAILGENHFLVPLLVGAGVAFAAQNVFRNRLVRPLGTPTRTQVAAIVGAIVLEIILTGIVAYAFDFRQTRSFWLWILLVVGSHFLIIAAAQGRLLLILGDISGTNNGFQSYFDWSDSRR